MARLQRLRHLPLRVLPALGALALGAWLAWLGQDAWHYRAAIAAHRPQVLAPPEVQRTASAPLDHALVAQLFGVLPPGPRMSAEETARALSLSLLASFAESRPEHSRALLASSAGSAFYRPGQSLPGGAVLRAVAADHVLIERDGREYRLDFPLRANRHFLPLAPRAGAPSFLPEKSP